VLFEQHWIFAKEKKGFGDSLNEFEGDFFHFAFVYLWKLSGEL
jgi:hypothetical protein